MTTGDIQMMHTIPARMRTRPTVGGLALITAIVAGTSMSVTSGQTVALAQATGRPAGWNDATHGANVAPDYARLFSTDRVHEIRITMSADNFKAIQADLKAIMPAMPAMPPMPPGGRGGAPGLPGAPGPGGVNPMAALMEAGVKACAGKPAAASCSSMGTEGQCTELFGGPLMCVPPEIAKMGQGGAGLSLTTRDPIYVPVSVQFDGKVWTRVGMRYKGNSTLMAANMGGIGKIPFRLDFDKYDKESPEIRDQRFYGFGKLTFSSNFADDSQIRELLATEILRDRGVPAPRAAFYRVFIDAGAGAEYWGLYTMIEDPSDGAMLDAQLNGRSGNLYKPDGKGADWTTFAEAGFVKKTNEKDADFSDVSAARSPPCMRLAPIPRRGAPRSRPNSTSTSSCGGSRSIRRSRTGTLTA
jgi:spore coat protein H